MADSGKSNEMAWAVLVIIILAVIFYIGYTRGWWLKKVASTPTTPTPGTSGPGTTGTTGTTTPNPSPPVVVTTPPTSGGLNTIRITAQSADTSTQYWAVFNVDPGVYLGHNQWANAQPISDTIQMAGDTLTLSLGSGTYYFSTTGGSTYNVSIGSQALGTTTYGSTVKFTI